MYGPTSVVRVGDKAGYPHYQVFYYYDYNIHRLQICDMKTNRKTMIDLLIIFGQIGFGIPDEKWRCETVIREMSRMLIVRRF